MFQHGFVLLSVLRTWKRRCNTATDQTWRKTSAFSVPIPTNTSEWSKSLRNRSTPTCSSTLTNTWLLWTSWLTSLVAFLCFPRYDIEWSFARCVVCGVWRHSGEAGWEACAHCQWLPFIISCMIRPILCSKSILGVSPDLPSNSAISLESFRRRHDANFRFVCDFNKRLL